MPEENPEDGDSMFFLNELFFVISFYASQWRYFTNSSKEAISCFMSGLFTCTDNLKIHSLTPVL